MFPNPWVILGFVGFLLLSVGGASWLAYDRGRDDTLAAQTKQELADTKAEVARNKSRQSDGQKAAQEHDSHEDEIARLYALLRSKPGAVAIRPDTDPFVPVWFVRMHDRAASGWIDGDPYPGKSDNDASDVRLSQALAMLVTNYEGFQVNRSRLLDIGHLQPVLPALPPPTETTKPSVFERLF